MKTETEQKCECGHPNPRWHGDRHSLRVFRCDNCERIERAIFNLRSAHLQDNKHRLGVLGAQDVDMALSSLLSELE